ncbi:MAG: CHAT domain-containing protein [Caldilinea sp. CFX5]|nr:CHAT domain-containing protein [Caldilinea sp. CFX5]
MISTTLVEEWLTCPDEAQQTWLADHRADLGIPFLDLLKQKSDQLLRSDPKTADRVTQSCLLVAEQLLHEPLAYPLACWARGNWACYHDPQQAIYFYQQALRGYRHSNNEEAKIRLLSNLIAACLETGDFTTAYQAYDEVHLLAEHLHPENQHLLISPEQNYGLLLHTIGHYVEALAAHERARAFAERFAYFDRMAEIDVNRALTLCYLDRLAEGEQLLLASRPVAATLEHHLTVARIDMNLGELYMAQGRPADAMRRLQSARQQFAHLNTPMEVGSILLREAALFERIGVLNEARRSYASAYACFTDHQMWPQVGHVLLQGAIVNRRYGEYKQAIQLLTEAAALWQRLQQPAWERLVYLEYATLYLAYGNSTDAIATLTKHFTDPTLFVANPALQARYQLLWADIHTLCWQRDGKQTDFMRAREIYQQVLAYSQTHSQLYLQRQALTGLGRLLQADDAIGARSLLEQAVGLDDQIRQELSIQELKASFIQQSSDLFPLLIRLVITQNEPRQALTYLWRAKGAALLELFAVTKQLSSPIAQENAEVEQELAQVRQQLAILRYHTLRHNIQDGPDNLSEENNAEIRQLQHLLQTLRRQRNQALQQAHFSQWHDPAQLLQQNDADLLIEYMRCDQQLLAVCATAKGEYHHTWLADVDIILDLIDEINLSFQSLLTLSDDIRVQRMTTWLAECQPLLAKCYDLLIAPLGISPATSCLLIAPCDPLYFLPFAAFWNGQEYLVENYTIELIPSGALLAAPLPDATSSAPPLLIAASAESKLQSTHAEVQAIQRLFPDSTCLCDVPTTLTHLFNLPAAPCFLHIAAHTIIHKATPLFSALQLTDALLSVEQCYDLALHGTELVTLSGCTTAAGLESGGALLAFQSAFFTAGAKRILSTLWPVGDEVTTTWMGLFYHSLAAGLAPAVALRQTQLAFINNPKVCHPAQWAAFTCTRR